MEEKQISDAIRLAEIIGRWINGESLSLGEQEMLNGWEHAAAENRQLKDQLANTDFQIRELQTMQAYDWQSGWNNASQRLHPKKSRVLTLYRIAAAVALLIGLVGGALLLNQGIWKSTEPRPLGIKGDLPPAATKAYIQLAGGKQILLDARNDSSFYSGNTLVHQQNGQLAISQRVSAVKNPEYLSLITPNGGTYSLLLPDGTKAWLNAGSSLKFPDHFTGNSREVSLSGEAYFEVIHDPSKPFIVKVDGSQVLALGTDFNVRAYKEDMSIKATLVSGIVQVVSGSEKSLLKPGKMATITATGTTIVNANLTQVTAWKNDLFLFKDIPIQEAIQELARWYDIKVSYAPGFDRQSRFTARISRKVPISQLLSLMEQTSIASFRLEGRILTIIPYQSNH